MASVPEAVLAWAERTPDAAAFSGPERTWTYQELAVKAGEAGRLLAALGVGREDLVAVELPRSPELVAVLLGVWLSGAAYVPIDPLYPAERRRMILEDSGARVLVTDESGGAAHEGVRTLAVDELWSPAAGTEPPELTVDASQERDRLAYVIYTSGSTGRPKGVMVEHASLADFVTADPRLAIEPGQRVAHLAPTAFDASVFEIWAALAHGAEICAFPEGGVSVEGLGGFLRTVEPDWLFLTSGLFSLLAEFDLDALSHVGTLITGGDVLSPKRVDMAATTVRRTVMAAYGPTETTVFASLHPVVAPVGADRVPIGTPPKGTDFYVLDDAMARVGAGTVGMLYVSGPGVARGYLGRPDLTEECFLPDPFSDVPGTRMYRTGDLACETPEGVFQFHGRADRQVKIRGFRVELGEIESVAEENALVSAATAVVYDEGPSYKRMALFVRAVAGAAPTAAELRTWIGNRLPAFMVPSAIVLVPEFPLDPNGKVDRRTFPHPWASRADFGLGEDWEPPVDSLEETIAAVWADVLTIDSVGRSDNFFELGGDSLRSVAMVARLAEEGIAIRGEFIFDYQTVAELAAFVAGGPPDTAEAG